MAAIQSSRAALLLVTVTLSVSLLSGKALGQERRPWRSTSAPATESSLLAFASVQPPEGDEDGGQEDTTRVREPGEGTTTPTNTTNPFEKADSTRGQKGTITIPGTNPAPIETLGAPGAFHGTQATNTPLPTGPHPRRGILGIHPLALLVGLVALHIFIVTTVIK